MPHHTIRNDNTTDHDQPLDPTLYPTGLNLTYMYCINSTKHKMR